MKEKLLNARVPLETIKQVEEIAREESTDKSTIIRRLLAIALKKWVMEKAVNLYREKKLTLEKAAAISKISVRELINYLRREEVEIGTLSVSEIEKDIEEMYKRIKK